MRERPILFNGPMVRALLDGSKTQTRRVVKPQPVTDLRFVGGAFIDQPKIKKSIAVEAPYVHGACPHGQLGDRLYVRETHMDCGPNGVWYRADYDGPEPHISVGRWTPSIHMPRWASRITLEVTSVRVERLQAMEGQTAFESDALKEGIHRIHHGDGEYSYHVTRTEPHPNNWTDPCDAFRDLWDSLNAARGYGWVLNPWVWVIEFKRITS